jgi:hypothetical protein
MAIDELALQFDGRLTNIALQYKNPELIADLVVPPVPVPQKKFTYKSYTKEDRFTVPDTIVGPKSIPNEADFGVSSGTGTCLDYGLQEFVSQEDIDNAELPITPLADAAEQVTALMALDREIRVANAINTAGNYGTTLDLNGSWATLTNDILAQILTGIDTCFLPPNVMVMGLNTWRAVSRNEKILAAVKGTGALAAQIIPKGGKLASPSVSQMELADFLGLDAVLVGKAKRNSAVEGQTGAYPLVWGGTVTTSPTTKGMAALLRVKTAAVKDVFWGANFRWKDLQTYRRNSDRGAYGGEVIRVVTTEVLKVVATDVGYLFIDTLIN